MNMKMQNFFLPNLFSHSFLPLSFCEKVHRKSSRLPGTSRKTPHSQSRSDRATLPRTMSSWILNISKVGEKKTTTNKTFWCSLFLCALSLILSFGIPGKSLAPPSSLLSSSGIYAHSCDPPESESFVFQAKESQHSFFIIKSHQRCSKLRFQLNYNFRGSS